MKYHVDINSPEDGGSVTRDIVTVTGKPKRRRRAFMKYLAYRMGTHDYHRRVAVIRALGFKDLL